MSMYGRVTDVQMFGRVLSDSEMEEITNCDVRKEGDILSWDSANWVLKEDKGRIRKESLVWEKDVCKSADKSYHIISETVTFIPESLDICQKISAKLAWNRNKIEFGEIPSLITSYHKIMHHSSISTDILM